MRTMLVACLLLTACSAPQLTAEGARVQWSESDPAGCRPLGTVREVEGGGLRSYEANRGNAVARLRNDAAQLGANAMVLVSEVHGQNEDGWREFNTGVAGLSTPNPICSNCVALTARAYACASPLTPAVAQAPAPPHVRVRPAPPLLAPAEPAPVAEPAELPAPPPPPAAPATQPIIVPVPAGAPVIIIIQPQGAPPPQQ